MFRVNVQKTFEAFSHRSHLKSYEFDSVPNNNNNNNIL